MTVEALRRGEPQVLAELLSQYGREIQGVAYLILRNRADAEAFATTPNTPTDVVEQVERIGDSLVIEPI